MPTRSIVGVIIIITSSSNRSYHHIKKCHHYFQIAIYSHTQKENTSSQETSPNHIQTVKSACVLLRFKQKDLKKTKPFRDVKKWGTLFHYGPKTRPRRGIKFPCKIPDLKCCSRPCGRMEAASATRMLMPENVLGMLQLLCDDGLR